jgi:hypothetical protein
LRAPHAETAGPACARVLRLLCDASHIASSVLRGLGHPADAWLGAERCRGFPLTAERIAPQHVRTSAELAQTVRVLLNRSRLRAGGAELRALSERMQPR